ncbi:MAG: DNA/RNA nuclease SfsA [Lachnospiraceae bacterium]|nr:DNA/RNA nuclease SfsA [Lachnospiraceae bacterium]
MKYTKTIQAKFIDRPNRFIAHVEVDGKVETVHVKNTGRCRELLLPGVTIILAVADNPNRKTKYDLIAVYKDGIGLINMDSQAPNVVVGEYLARVRDITYIKPEYTYGDSRIDFYFEQGETKCLMEVKGVTLEREGIAYFPDAPTERGVKHIRELIKAKEQGFDAYLAFVIQMEGVHQVLPNEEMHPEFAEVYREAVAAGVKVVNFSCRVREDELWIEKENRR